MVHHLKPLDTLTQQAKRRRLTSLAKNALENYDLQVTQIRFFRQETNTLFRLITSAGESLVLKIYSEDSTAQENLAEVTWLNALSRESEIQVAAPVPRRDGQFLTHAHVDGIPGIHRCVLFHWVPGRPLIQHMTPNNYFDLGKTVATLHKHAQIFNLPQDIHPKRWDQVFYYPAEPIVYHEKQYQHLFPPERVTLLDQVVNEANVFLSSLYHNDQPPILIHGDLNPWNIHIFHKQIYVLDFEDVLLGYPIQDIAILLYYEQDHPNFQDLVKAFKKGYCLTLAWPVESQRQLETLWAARRAMFVNYVAHTDPDPEQFIESRCVLLQTFLDCVG
ncbi:MAG TPA: phosphotransferase [Anaerolineales bacterium]|nr:phosphotransferase [Anaerolineales bacterium]